jgi:hypothetical protein
VYKEVKMPSVPGTGTAAGAARESSSYFYSLPAHINKDNSGQAKDRKTAIIGGPTTVPLDNSLLFQA